MFYVFFVFYFFICYLTVKLFSRSLKNKLDERDLYLVIRILILAIAIRALIVVIWYSNVGHSFAIYEGSTKDSGFYDSLGKVISNNLRHFVFFKKNYIDLTGPYIGYPYFVGIIYLFGTRHIFVSLINLFLNIQMAILIYLIAYMLYDKKIAMLAMAFNLFYPHYVSQSYYILKDMTVLYLIALSSYFILKYGYQKKFIYFVVSVIIVSLSYFLRPPLPILLIPLIGVYLLLLKNLKVKQIINNAVAILSIITLFFALGNYFQGKGSTAFERINNFTIGIEGYQEERAPQYLQGAKGPADILKRIMNNKVAFGKNIIKGTILVLFGPTDFYSKSGPFIMKYRGRFILFENMGVIFRMLIMPMILFGALYTMKEKTREGFFIYSFIFIWFIAVWLTGERIRWPLSLMPFLLMLGAVGIVKYEHRVKSIYIPYVMLINILVTTNVTMRDALIVAKPLLLITAIMAASALLWHRKSFL